MSEKKAVAGGLDKLSEIKLVTNVGRFEHAQSIGGAVFGKTTLLFGENGRGKSTIADVLRSLAEQNPQILEGRATLNGGTDQKVILRFGEKTVMFEDGEWKGKLTPRVAIYDSVFVNNNIYSGDVLSNEHLKNQFGLVVGEEGVRKVKRIIELDDKNRANNQDSNRVEGELKQMVAGVSSGALTLKQFLELENESDIEAKITQKTKDVEVAKKANEIKSAAVPDLLPIPSETESFRQVLHSTIDSIAEDAVDKLKEHVEQYDLEEGSFESWLETGSRVHYDDKCPFCGQDLKDLSLVNAYSSFFSEAYTQVADELQQRLKTLSRYEDGQYRARFSGIVESYTGQFNYWKEAGTLDVPVLPDTDEILENCESAAEQVIAVLESKQKNLTKAMTGEGVEQAMLGWDKARSGVFAFNEQLQTYTDEINKIKESADSSELPRLQGELMLLQAQKKRFESDTVDLVDRLNACKTKKESIKTEKDETQRELAEHGSRITDKLGKAINGYLGDLNAGFRINYEQPNYRTKEPSASFEILINNVGVSSKSSDDLSEPSFRNTLSAGDKSTLALAFFLAKVKTESDLSELIVVLDDPFTSLDDFRKQFTCTEIRKLSKTAGQMVVLSHDRNFLRLLWDKLDKQELKSLAIHAAGSAGHSTIAAFDVEAETKPRHITERGELEEYALGERNHGKSYIRSRLRTVCESFYRRSDPSRFHEAANLDEIIRLLRDAPDDYPYKERLDDLEGINTYSRTDHHAEIEGDPNSDTTEDELVGFCKKVLDITSGM